ncbi:hypothetical protein JNK13_08975 [bacterium]|nr:hypothetical protein [bacterium]
MSQSVTCFHCSKSFEIPDGTVARGEECPHCRADARVCRNCRHYDLKAYNECREPQAERIVDKEKRNMCDFFVIGLPGSSTGAAKADALKALDDLFKK